MPTYEYRCENGHEFEEFQSIVAAPIEVCPFCGGKAERLISAGSGLIFKGSGFYITDYKNKHTGGTISSTKGGHSAPESKPDAPKETKESKPQSGSKSDS